jgi:hypothetical protein
VELPPPERWRGHRRLKGNVARRALKGAQVGEQGRRGLVALRRRGAQASQDDAVQAGRCVSWQGRPAFDQARHAGEDRGMIGAEGMLARRELPGKHAEREDVGTRVGFAAAQLFGR